MSTKPPEKNRLIFFLACHDWFVGIMKPIFQFLAFSCLVSQIYSENSTTEKEIKGHLLNHPACKNDLLALSKYCGLSSQDMEDDFATLTCAQNLPPEKFEAISETCEQVLWRFKLNLTTSPIFLEQIDKACSRDAEFLDSCKHRFPGKKYFKDFLKKKDWNIQCISAFGI